MFLLFGNNGFWSRPNTTYLSIRILGHRTDKRTENFLLLTQNRKIGSLHIDQRLSEKRKIQLPDSDRWENFPTKNCYCFKEIVFFTKLSIAFNHPHQKNCQREHFWCKQSSKTEKSLTIRSLISNHCKRSKLVLAFNPSSRWFHRFHSYSLTLTLNLKNPSKIRD